MQELKIDPVPLLRRACVPLQALTEEQTQVSVYSVAALLEASALPGRCPDVGLRMAAVDDIRILGPLAIQVKRAETIADVVEAVSRRLCLQNPGVILSVTASSLIPDGIEIRVALRLPRDTQARQLTDRSLGQFHRILKYLARECYEPLAVTLPHAPIAPLSAYTSFFGAPVVPSQAYAGIHVSQSMLGASFGSDSEHLVDVSERFSDLHLRDPGTSMSSRVRLALMSSLSVNNGRQLAIAELIGMHERTLQRRLDDEGTTFHAISEEVRRDAAIRFLRETDLPLSAVAHAVGFSRQSALTRSCRRWFGATPIAVRYQSEYRVPRKGTAA
ncbi:MAG: AraC family transcriptional regulator [Pseudomonadota bacterium]|nr:AraC family transcriptional regulator [Pseudomonadota bacterium]